MKITPPLQNLICLLLATASTTSHAFHMPPATTQTTTMTRVEPLSMIRKSKKTAPKQARASGGGFGSSSSSSTASSSTLRPPSWANRFPFAGDIRPGAQTEQKVVTEGDIVPPDYALDGSPKNARPMLPWVIEVKTADEIANMRESGRLARKVLDLAGRAVQPGVTTNDIDELVHQATIEVRACVLASVG